MRDLRFILLLIFFAAGMLCCLVKGCRIAGPEKARIIQRGEKIARKWRNIPAKRGRILDRDGKVLVWSELYFDLYYNERGRDALSEMDEAALTAIFGKINLDVKPGRLLRPHLKPDEIIALEPLLLRGAPLEISHRHERLTCASEKVRMLAGNVLLRNNVQYGVSGWELKYELDLRGLPGSFSVLLDRFGNYMPKSFRLSVAPSDGRDVRLPESLAEIENGDSRL